MKSVSNDAAYCLELAELGNPLFRLSRVFAGEQQELLTAVHAFFASIQIIGSSIQEEDVARHKISWWQNECRPENLAVSNHPVLRELGRHSGVAECLDQMQVILAGAEHRLENIPPSDEQSFIVLCREIGTPLVDMELSVSGCASSRHSNLDDLVLRRGLWTLICESFGPKGQGGAWWLPMSLLARAGLSREQLTSNPSDAACRGLYKQAIKYANLNTLDIDISAFNQSVTNLFVLDSLIVKRLNVLSQKAPDEYPSWVQKTGVSDLVKAWSTARKVSRQR